MIHTYIRPVSIAEALEAKKSAGDSFWYAGGTRINNAEYGIRSGTAVSLELLGLKGIESRGEDLVIGSMVTLQELVDCPDVPEAIRKAAAFVTSRNIRNAATIGGNIGAATTDSALIPLLRAYGALLETADAGSIPIDTYHCEGQENLILNIVVPLAGRPAAVRKIARSSASAPIVSAAVVITGTDAGTIESAGIIIGGLGRQTTRLTGVEKELAGISLSGFVSHGSLPEMAGIAEKTRSSIEPEEDYRCSREYKQYIAVEIVKECIAKCAGGAV